MPALTVAVQMDPIGLLRPETDTTLLLMQEAARRGHAVAWYEPKDLGLENGEVKAYVRPVEFTNDPVHFYRQGEKYRMSLAEADVVLMRQDPPFNMEYITATYLLERLHPKTLVVNNPAAVRNYPEKLFPLEFAEFIPPTLISANADDIRAFHREQGEIVLKPLYGFGGKGVFHIGKEGANLETLVEMPRDAGNPVWIAQRFIPAVKEKERRLVFIDGKMVAVFARLPASGEIRSNMRVGGMPAKASLSARQEKLAEVLGPRLQKDGLPLAGVDMIDEWLIEINITCPTGLRVLQKLYGMFPERDFWDAVERRL